MGQSWTRSWGTDTLASGGKITEDTAAKAANQPTAGEKAAATLFFAEAGKRHWVANVYLSLMLPVYMWMTALHLDKASKRIPQQYV